MIIHQYVSKAVQDDGAQVQVPQRRNLGDRWYEIQRYRPRVESLFAGIERWRDLSSGETRWRALNSANVTTRYGATPDSRIADPVDPARVFSWLICESYDDTGKATAYLAEDSAGVRAELASDRKLDLLQTATSATAGGR